MVVYPLPPQLPTNPYLDDLYAPMAALGVAVRRGRPRYELPRLLLGRGPRILHLHFFDELTQRPGTGATAPRSLLFLALLLALRLPFVRCGTFGSDVPNFNDENNYITLAHSLATGDTTADTTWAYTRAPAAALLLLGLARLKGLPPEFVVCEFQFVQITIWAALMLVVAGITAALFDRRAALVAALLLALTPEIALLALLEVIFGIVLAWIGADEIPSQTVLAGGALVIGALVVNEVVGWRQRA